jgi:hypothetical protein
MGLPGGAGSQFGLKKEVTYGTAIAVDRFLLMLSESVVAETQPFFDRGIGGGFGLMQDVSGYRQIVTGHTGDTPITIRRKAMGVLFQAIFGTGVSAQVSTTTEYTQTFKPDLVNGEIGSTYTVQFGRAQRNGTVTPFTYDGGKVVSAKFECAQGGALMVTPTWAFHAEHHTGAAAYALATPTFATGNFPWTWDAGVVTLNGVSRLLKSIDFTIDKGFALDDNGLGQALRDEPVPNGEYAVTGTIDARFENVTDYEAFIAGTVIPITVTFTSTDNITGASLPYKIIFTMANCVYTGDTPTVGGQEILRQPLPFKAMWDGTLDIINCVIHTSDTAL